MKRRAWLLLAAVLSFNTAGFAPPASPLASLSTTISGPPAGADRGPLAASIPGYNVVCENIRATRLCVSVSDARVKPGSYVTVYGMMKTRGVGEAGKIMRVMWSSRASATCIGLTDENGLASCRTYVPLRTAGARNVHVRVWMDKFKLATSFITRRTSQDPRSPD